VSNAAPLPDQPPSAPVHGWPRLPDWQVRLATLVGDRLQAPFVWGRNDCALFAADAVQAILGHDLAAPWRGQYHTATGAARLLDSLGGGLQALATHMLGQPISPRLARPGDVVLMAATPAAPRECLGICNGATALGPAAWGLAARSMAEVSAAWRVGV